MKKITHVARCFLLACCLLAPHFGKSQTLHLPSNPNNNVIANPAAFEGINTAMLEYTGGYIYAVAYKEVGSNLGSVSVYDASFGFLFSVNYTNLNGVPDIAIGNDVSNPTTKYRLAFVYSDNTGVNPVNVDFYSFDLTGGFSPLGSSVLTSSVFSTVHVDVMADTTNTLPTSFPFCDSFIVAWDDAGSGTGSSVNAAAGSLNMVSVGLPQLIDLDAYMPDVSAVHRRIPGFSANHLNGLITYVRESSHNRLYVTTWDVPTGGISTPVVLDNGGSSSDISYPRIDAFDDLMVGSALPSISGHATYKVVAEVTTIGSHKEIRTYDDLMGPTSHYVSSNVIDITPVPTYSTTYPPYYHFRPTVAVMKDKEFLVSHYTTIDTLTNDSCIVFLEPISYSAPATITDYYWVNSELWGIPAQPCNYANAVSTPPNGATNLGIVSWAAFDPSSGIYRIYNKFTTSSLSFKEVELETRALNKNVNFDILPNPAARSLQINSSAGKVAFHYAITDVAGITLVEGNAITGNRLDISMLLPGTYVISVNGTSLNKRLLFVKQ